MLDLSGADYLVSIAQIGDAADLSVLGRLTFTETFGHLYTPENLEAFLAESHSPEWYAYAIEADDVGVWIVRKDAGEAIAYAVAGPNTLPVEGAEPDSGEIKRIYVRQGQQGLGLGRHLIDTMLDWLAGRGFGPLYVGVYSDNLGAQLLYASYGFEKVGEYIFPVGTHQDREFILQRR